jgi:glycogen debranching enzyme
VQGYVYAAFIGRSELAAQLGHHDDAAHWAAVAEEFRNRFDALFWLPELSRYATAIETSGNAAASVTSNLGHCLWSGIVPRDKAPAIAAALRSPAMWSGWGVRTLAADEPGFDPLSYHCGSVWPHDSAIVAAGLAHYGFRDDAARIVSGLCDAADVWDGRMPELFAGFDKADVAVPVSYPTSCSPQAWAAAAAVLAARLVFGIEPDLLHNRVTWAPETLPGFAGSAMQGVRFWNRTLDCTSHPSTGRIEATVSSRKHEGTPQP